MERFERLRRLEILDWRLEIGDWRLQNSDQLCFPLGIEGKSKELERFERLRRLEILDFRF